MGITVASSIVFVGTASAWTNYVSGVATCSSNSSSYSITWTIENGANAAEVVTATSATGGLSTVSGSPVDIPASPGEPYKSATMSQVLPASTASPASLTVKGVWTGGTTLSDSGTATLPKCPVPGQLAGHIYNCPSGVATTNEVSGGTLGASGPQTVATQANPLNPTDVLAGTYTMTATPPTGYRLVTCNGTSTVNSSGTSATESVTVPAGGSGTGIFYASLITQSLAGHIYNCPSGVATTNEVSGGTLGATGPQTVATQANPLNPTDVLAGTYTMTATPPTGYRLVTCNGTSTVNSSGTSATESVIVPAGGSGTGIFYVSLVPVTTAAGATTPTTTTTRVSGPVLGPVTSSTTPVTKSHSGALAFTGFAGFFMLLGLGLASVLAGSAILLSRRRWMKAGLTNPSASASKDY